MPRTNKYPGTCVACGGRVAARSGTLERAGRVWTVTHLDCDRQSHSAASPVSHVFQTSGGTFYRNTRGRCEDAPCCGCCTI